MLMRRTILPMDTLNEALVNPDFLALGMGGTNMMSMIWTVAIGRRAVGVEMRGDPFLGVHWNIREDFYHQLGLKPEALHNGDVVSFGSVKATFHLLGTSALPDPWSQSWLP
jgi:hypothetical protein